MNKAPIWLSPYSVEPWWPCGFTIRFEDMTRLGWYAFRSDVEAICNQLNGAYNLGRASMKLELESDTRQATGAVGQALR